MTIKIYDGMAGFTSTGRVLATLFEKGVTDFEFVKVDIFGGEQKNPEYLKLQVGTGQNDECSNPSCRILWRCS